MVILASAGSGIFGITPAVSSTFAGGMITSDLALLDTSQPYMIKDTIQIPDGVKLSIGPGVEVINETFEPLFYIHGALDIQGTRSSPARITSNGPILYLKNAPKTSSVSIQYARVDGQNSGSLVAATGYSQSSNFYFAYSEFVDFGWSYIWYPESFLAYRNVFSNGQGFSVGFSAQSGESAPEFLNNLFLGPPKLGPIGEVPFWIEAWAAYGSTPLRVNGNTFSGGPYTAILSSSSNTQNPVDATGNYWGTADAQLISEMVMDSRDSLDYGIAIDTSSPLSDGESAPGYLAYTPDTQPVPTDSSGPTVNSVSISNNEESPYLAFDFDVSDESGVWMVGLLCKDPLGNYSVDTRWDLMNDDIGLWDFLQNVRLQWRGTIWADFVRANVSVHIPRNSDWEAGRHTCDVEFRDWVQTDSNWTTLKGAIDFLVPRADQVSYLRGDLKTGDKIYAGSTQTFTVNLAAPKSVVLAGVRLRSLTSGQYRDIGPLSWIGDESGSFRNQLTFPSDLAAGEYEMQIWWTPEYSPGVKEVYSVNVEVLSQPAATGVEQYRGHGPDDGEFSVWTKLLANGTQIKFYGKYLQPGQKVQFMFQNLDGFYDQVAWKRITDSDLADDGGYTNLQNHVYFIRTFDLKPGKNRVRILVDGEIVWGTKTYTLK